MDENCSAIQTQADALCENVRRELFIQLFSLSHVKHLTLKQYREQFGDFANIESVNNKQHNNKPSVSFATPQKPSSIRPTPSSAKRPTEVK